MFPHLLAPSRHLVMPLRFLSVGWGGGGGEGGSQDGIFAGRFSLGRNRGEKFKRRFQNKGNA
jgi:hypothetical protein